MHDLVPLTLVPLLLVGLPWLILHYITRWKTASTLTRDDEELLEELYQLARRLDERMETVERLVAADHPEFQSLSRPRLAAEAPRDERTPRAFDRLPRQGDRR